MVLQNGVPNPGTYILTGMFFLNVFFFHVLSCVIQVFLGDTAKSPCQEHAALDDLGCCCTPGAEGCDSQIDVGSQARCQGATSCVETYRFFNEFFDI